MNLQTLVKGINGIIPGGMSIKDFSIVTRMDEETVRVVFDNFLQNGIGTYEDNQIFFDENDRLKTCLLAIQMGAPVDEVSRSLDWKDFESLAAEILDASEFETTRNLVLKKPRMQIDVVGRKSDVAILIDCKHWKKASQSALENAVKKQIERTKRFLKTEDVKAAIPAIVTLYQEIRFIDKVPIIPIFQLSSFCEEFYGNLDDLNTLEHS
ncbi:MAG: restriction endonuclease [Nitrosopumilaceae archaeon]